MYNKIQGQKIDTKKDIQDLPTKGSYKKSFTAANFSTLPRIAEILFFHGIFGVETSLC